MVEKMRKRKVLQTENLTPVLVVVSRKRRPHRGDAKWRRASEILEVVLVGRGWCF